MSWARWTKLDTSAILGQINVASVSTTRLLSPAQPPTAIKSKRIRGQAHSH